MEPPRAHLEVRDLVGGIQSGGIALADPVDVLLAREYGFEGSSLESVEGVHTRHWQRRFLPAIGMRLGDFLEFAADEPPDLFPGLLARGLNVWGGPPRSMKSMAAMGAMLSVASGKAFLGREPSRTGSVLYVAEEGGRSKIAERFRIIARSLAPTHEVFILHRSGVTFQTPERWEYVEKTLSAMNQPALVVLDTYSRLNSLDENTSAAAHEALSAMSGLARDFGVDTVLVHHTGHKNDRLRGHSSLKAGADGTVLFRRSGTSNRLTLDGETKDSDPISLQVRWDPETFLLSLSGQMPAAEPAATQRIVSAVESLGGRLQAVRTSDLQRLLVLSRTTVQSELKAAVEANLILPSGSGPQRGYRLVEHREREASNENQWEGIQPTANPPAPL